MFWQRKFGYPESFFSDSAVTKKVCFRHDSRMEFKADIDKEGGRWTGQAVIPADQFPPNVTRFNAFAAHSQSGEDKKV